MTEVDPCRYDGFFEAHWLDYVQPAHDATLRQVDFLVEELAGTRTILLVRKA